MDFEFFDGRKHKDFFGMYYEAKMKAYRRKARKKILKFFVLLFVLFVLNGIIQLSSWMYSEVKEEYTEFVTELRVKRNQQQTSSEWQKKRMNLIKGFRKKIEETRKIFLIMKTGLPPARRDYYELVRFHNSLVREYQTAILRYLHGSQYISVKESLWEILPKEIPI